MYAQPDPKKLAAERRRLRSEAQERELAAARIRQIAREKHACYKEYSPMQIAKAGEMIHGTVR